MRFSSVAALAVVVVVGSGCSFVLDRFSGDEPGDVKGTAIEDDLGDGSGIAPAANAGISSLGSTRVYRAGSDGDFLLRGLAGGAHTLKFLQDDDGDGVGERGTYRKLVLSKDPSTGALMIVDLGRVSLLGAANLHGTVTDEDGVEVLGADVVAFLRDGTKVSGAQADTAADTSGGFLLNGVIPGETSIAAFATIGADTFAGEVVVDAKPSADPDAVQEIDSVVLLPDNEEHDVQVSFRLVGDVDDDATVKLRVAPSNLAGAPPIEKDGLKPTETASLQLRVGLYDVDVYVDDVLVGALRTQPVLPGDAVEWLIDVEGGDICDDPDKRDEAACAPIIPAEGEGEGEGAAEGEGEGEPPPNGTLPPGLLRMHGSPWVEPFSQIAPYGARGFVAAAQYAGTATLEGTFAGQSFNRALPFGTDGAIAIIVVDPDAAPSEVLTVRAVLPDTFADVGALSLVGPRVVADDDGVVHVVFGAHGAFAFDADGDGVIDRRTGGEVIFSENADVVAEVVVDAGAGMSARPLVQEENANSGNGAIRADSVGVGVKDGALRVVVQADGDLLIGGTTPTSVSTPGTHVLLLVKADDVGALSTVATPLEAPFPVTLGHGTLIFPWPSGYLVFARDAEGGGEGLVYVLDDAFTLRSSTAVPAPNDGIPGPVLAVKDGVLAVAGPTYTYGGDPQNVLGIDMPNAEHGVYVVLATSPSPLTAPEGVNSIVLPLSGLSRDSDGADNIAFRDDGDVMLTVQHGGDLALVDPTPAGLAPPVDAGDSLDHAAVMRLHVDLASAAFLSPTTSQLDTVRARGIIDDSSSASVDATAALGDGSRVTGGAFRGRAVFGNDMDVRSGTLDGVASSDAFLWAIGPTDDALPTFLPCTSPRDCIDPDDACGPLPTPRTATVTFAGVDVCTDTCTRNPVFGTVCGENETCETATGLCVPVPSNDSCDAARVLTVDPITFQAICAARCDDDAGANSCPADGACGPQGVCVRSAPLVDVALQDTWFRNGDPVWRTLSLLAGHPTGLIGAVSLPSNSFQSYAVSTDGAVWQFVPGSWNALTGSFALPQAQSGRVAMMGAVVEENEALVVLTDVGDNGCAPHVDAYSLGFSTVMTADVQSGPPDLAGASFVAIDSQFGVMQGGQGASNDGSGTCFGSLSSDTFLLNIDANGDFKTGTTFDPLWTPLSNLSGTTPEAGRDGLLVRVSDDGSGNPRVMYLLDNTWIGTVFPAAGNVSWSVATNQDSGPLPPPRRNAQALHVSFDELLVFGGTSPDGEAILDDAWIFNVSTQSWRRLSASDGRGSSARPNARARAAFASSDDGFVQMVFGGFGPANVRTDFLGNPVVVTADTTTAFIDGAGSPVVGELDAGVRLPALASPAATTAVNGDVFVFGGQRGALDGDRVYSDELWRLPAGQSDWQRLGPTGNELFWPAPRAAAAIVFDESTQVLHLYGGDDGTTVSEVPTYFEDQWMFSFTTQNGPFEIASVARVDNSTQTFPGRRAGAAASFADGGGFLLFGGDAFNSDATVWRFDGSTWTSPALTGGPGARNGASLVRIGVDDYVLVGGAGDNTTWRLRPLDAQPWLQFPNGGLPIGTTGAGANVNGVVTWSDGNRVAEFDLSLEFWSDASISSGIGVDHNAFAAAAKDGALLLIGGYVTGDSGN